MAKGELHPEGQSLRPLNSILDQGLLAIPVLAFISFAASSILFAYLGYKLVAWHLFIKGTPQPVDPSQQDRSRGNTGGFQRTVDFALGIDGVFDDHSKQPAKTSVTESNGGTEPRQPRKRNPPNQFLVLVFNLLLADMHQSTAFFLNVVWLQNNEINVETAACFSQGLFVSLGDLASSCFITLIAIHTYLAIVRGWKMSQPALYSLVGIVWLFVYAISVVPILATKNGYASGGFFVRAGAWVSCSQNEFPLCLSVSIDRSLANKRAVLDEHRI